MTRLTLNLDDVTAEALDRLTEPGGSREEAVVIALQEYLFKRERQRRRALAARDAAVLAENADLVRRQAAALVADAPGLL